MKVAMQSLKLRSNVFKRVYKITGEIPIGKVMTYGEIGKILGITPRVVGWALHANKDKNVPCHRVVNKEGKLADNFSGPQAPDAQAIGRRAFDGWKEQRRRLIVERVGFVDERHVDLKRFRYSFI